MKDHDPDLPHRVLTACMEIHRQLGPGLDREAYLRCVAIELRQMEIAFGSNQELSFEFRGQTVTAGGRLDFVIEDELLLQVMTGPEVLSADLAHAEALMRLSRLRTGLVVNFHVTALRKGVHRLNLRRRRSNPDVRRS